MWPEYARRMRDVVATLTDEQRAVRPTAERWPKWATVGHLACQAGSSGCATSPASRARPRPPFTNAANDCPGDDDLDTVLDAPALVEALDSTFRIVESCLDRWTLRMLDEVIRRDDYGPDWVHTRGSVLQRVFSNDVWHVAEIDETLTREGLPTIYLWD